MMMFKRQQRTVRSGDNKIEIPLINTKNLYKGTYRGPPINRDRPGGLKFFSKDNKVHAINIEPDTASRLFFLNYNHRQRDTLTRYGIEPNPGPLTTITEDKLCIFSTGIYQYCHNCDTDLKLMESNKTFVVYLNNCPSCFKAQSQLLSEESKRDISEKVAQSKKWLMEGDKFGKSFLSHYANIPTDLDEYVNLIEDMAIMAYEFLYSTCLASRYISIVSFCKRRGSRIGLTQTLMCVAADLFGTQVANAYNPDPLQAEIEERLKYQPQSDDGQDNIFSEARKYVNSYEKLKETAIYKKLHKFSLYVLTLGLLDGVNITFDSLRFDKYHAKCIKSAHQPGMDMVHCMLDTVLFVCDKGVQYFKTGNADVIFHSGSSYEKWVNQANKLICDSKYLSNPEPLGIDKFSFLSRLKDAIEKGSAIIKFSSGVDKQERLYINKILNDLRMIEADQLTRKAAQMPRKDPFAILIHGSSSICKSQLKQILFYHYGKVFGLPTTADYMYTRCPTDEYWSGFNSTQWCIVMDDIAFLKPNNEVDPTLKEMLQVKNSVPYTPPQAALEDKGRTPVRAELVIGTTNTKHLNLFAYFACPFAIARRMSYVVTARVKPEFAKNKFMADSAKIPVTPEGEYMNIWDFEVSCPVPESDIEMDCQRTKYKLVKNFTDINEFLIWYIGVAKEHETSQIKALSADKVMCDIDVCKQCYKVSSKCTCYTPQSEEDDLLEEYSWFLKLQLWLFTNIVRGCENDYPMWLTIKYEQWFRPLKFPWLLIYFMLMYFFPIIIIISTFASFALAVIYKYSWCVLYAFFSRAGGMLWKYKLLSRITNNSQEMYSLMFRLAGQRVKQIHFTDKTLKKFAAYIAAPIFLLIVRKSIQSFLFGGKDKSEQQTMYEDQGNVGVVPIPSNQEKPTFYYNNPYVLSDVELSSASKCAQNDILTKLVIRNTAKFKFQFTEMPGKFSAGVGLNLVGNLWLLNNHVIKYDTGTVDIVLDPSDQNVSRNIAKITFCSKDITRIPNTDLAIMQIRAIAPGPNLVKYFPNKDIIRGCFSGKYHTISKNGERAIVDVVNIKGPGRCPVFGIAGYHGRVQFPTIVGDCGTVCVVDTGKGQVLLGTHTAGSLDGGVFLQHVSQDMLKPYVAKFHAQVECGDIVPISAPGYERHIANVHVKSCLRFIERGTATVYGSFTGYRPKHKSKVTDTFIAKHVIEAGYIKENGAPDMTWKPWHLALKDMTAPQYSFNNDVLDKCEDAFFGDIISIIDGEDLKLEVYTQDVALNGVDGVTFVDMLNTSTSAGNPFKKSKKHFIEVTPEGKIASVDPVIQQRVDDIRSCYDKGKQYHPQFCGHLKDTPMPYSKIESGKTRVFTGGEFAWSIVVRMYLLSHIRLIQNNPFVFEAMPGIVAQSKEWGNLYTYLTKHGTHKIVAGDYGKFDKKMAAAFILSAFRILERLAARAGWPEEDIQYIRCIAYDTAFPVIDFNGDLIQIQGNPSGHPLTVIINCLVNSLYMRYAYYHISGCDIRTFRRHVNLATYGDDNIMSVSDDCPNFNHTRISIILKAIGVEYTMAEKEAESVPYIHIKDASFLKRKFVYDPNVCAVVCPLDHSSIDKMLTSRLDEGLLDPRAHSICVIETALREYFFYGKEKYLDRLSFFKKLVIDLDLNDWVNQSTFPTYESLCEDFHNRLRNHPDHSIEMWGTRE